MNTGPMKVAMAKNLASTAHVAQTDLSGDDYMGHIERVASKFSSSDLKAVAYLHDTVEDSSISVASIRVGFGDEIADAVEAITHDPSDSYDEYIDDIDGNDMAALVKLADLEDNLDLSRLDSISPEDLNRCVTYGHAHRKLLEEDN